MLDKFIKSMQDAASAIGAQTSTLGGEAKKKFLSTLEPWLAAFNAMEDFGLVVHSFGLGISINPGLEAELRGSTSELTPEKIDALIEIHRGSTPLISVLKTIRTTYQLHSKVSHTVPDELFVKVSVKLSPEVEVFLGRPVLQ